MNTTFDIIKKEKPYIIAHVYIDMPKSFNGVSKQNLGWLFIYLV